MFHTLIPERSDPRRSQVVVIPWRGFRCFTLKITSETSENNNEVVIPWRGFRCFTLVDDGDQVVYRRGTVVIPWRGLRWFTLFGRQRPPTPDVRDAVVIPWRGFRCFTPRNEYRRIISR